MKILVTGSRGQLGRELKNVLEAKAPNKTTYIDIDTLDLTDEGAVSRYLRQGEFTHVVNCAAYTAVDLAEEEKAKCHAVNINAVANLARLADELDMRIIHLSTDYVFDGTAYKPYTESDKTAPQSVYASSKRKSETMLLGLSPNSIIIRTSWLYSPYRKNFVKTMLAQARTGKPLRVITDQIGTPTYAADLAEMISHIILRGPWTPGIFHYTNAGVASWYDLAVATLEAAGMPEIAAKITPIGTSDYPSPATRPHYSVLSKDKITATYGVKIPHWQASLRRCVKRIQEEGAEA